MLPPARGVAHSVSTASTGPSCRIFITRAVVDGSQENDVVRRGEPHGPKALIWITHSPEQSKRCGTRVFPITRG
jgi:hypothetical protein